MFEKMESNNGSGNIISCYHIRDININGSVNNNINELRRSRDAEDGEPADWYTTGDEFYRHTWKEVEG